MGEGGGLASAFPLWLWAERWEWEEDAAEGLSSHRPSAKDKSCRIGLTEETFEVIKPNQGASAGQTPRQFSQELVGQRGFQSQPHH